MSERGPNPRFSKRISGQDWKSWKSWKSWKRVFLIDFAPPISYRRLALKKQISLLVCLVGAHVPVAMAGPLTVPSLIGDHMVLQREIAVPIWGTANPGATVYVTFGDQTKGTTANPDGTWRVDLDSMAATTSPGTMTITSGAQALIFTDVQVGEV